LIYIDGIALAISPKGKLSKLIHKKADDSSDDETKRKNKNGN
jgi:hypothetical protein